MRIAREARLEANRPECLVRNKLLLEVARLGAGSTRLSLLGADMCWNEEVLRHSPPRKRPRPAGVEGGRHAPSQGPYGIPQPKRRSLPADGEKQTSVWQEARFGWNYLRSLPGLFGLLIYFASVNFFLSYSNVLVGPLVLSYGAAADLGVVQMVSGISMFAGSLVMSAWGGPKTRKVPALIGFIALSATGFLISGLRPNTLVISLGRVVLLGIIPFAGALSQAVFQVKIPPDIQGRVFAIRGMIARSMIPLAFLLSGPLADRFFEPLMAPGGALAGTFIGDLLGSGPGRGVGLMFIISCLFLWAESLLAYLNPRIRSLESEIPDAIPDQQPAAESALVPSPAPSD